MLQGNLKNVQLLYSEFFIDYPHINKNQIPLTHHCLISVHITILPYYRVHLKCCENVLYFYMYAGVLRLSIFRLKQF